MAELRWTDRAYAELEGIYLYVARDSSVAAQAITDAVYDGIQSLAAYPMRGRMVAELSGDYREIIVRGYRVVHRVEGDIIHITAILHGRRQIDPSEFR